MVRPPADKASQEGGTHAGMAKENDSGPQVRRPKQTRAGSTRVVVRSTNHWRTPPQPRRGEEGTRWAHGGRRQGKEAGSSEDWLD